MARVVGGRWWVVVYARWDVNTIRSLVGLVLSADDRYAHRAVLLLSDNTWHNASAIPQGPRWRSLGQ